MAGWLHQRGHAYRIGVIGSPAAGIGGRLFATTYIDLDGRVVGIAAIAPTRAEAAAEEAVRTWSATLRTRRVVLAEAPADCGPSPLLPHQVVRPQAVPDPGPAPGGCARAAATWATVKHFEARGDSVLLLGTGGGVPVDSEAEASCLRVRDTTAAWAVQPADPGRLSFVQRPCAPVEEVARILDVLRVRFPFLRGQHPDQWCYRTSDRRQVALAVAAASDLVLVGSGSAETDWIGPDRCVPFLGVQGLPPERVARAATIGMVAPLRCPGSQDDRTEEVIEALGGLGPLSVVRHSVRTEVMTDIVARPQGPRPGRHKDARLR
ncbi:hypothetical protein CFP65_6934 [Kitasatospora sp. MMS16-BH015]|nr:hypothetical protein CFP65_6934 [Kitasatospora sp. MMS16-BH015]